MKRLLDLVVALLVLLVLLPVFAMACLAIRLDSRGPAIFRQERVGLGGKTFQIFKFRTMIDGAAALGPYYTAANDGRITRVGRILRKTSMDELPQLMNVICGEMSLVGPRPNVFAQRADYSEGEWERRNSVRPGITGLAQATLRSEASPEQRIALDLEYIERQSLWMDLKIACMTVGQLIRRGGN